MLTDLLGYFKRNSKRMDANQIRRSLKEIKQIEAELERSLKLKGVI